MFQIELADKIEFFKSTATWNALGWDQSETCFYWQHRANKTVIRVHCDSLEVANREALSHEITLRRGSAKPLAKYNRIAKVLLSQSRSSSNLCILSLAWQRSPRRKRSRKQMDRWGEWMCQQVDMAHQFRV